MGADRDIILHPGRFGLNLRDDAPSLEPDELANSLNFRITALGSLEKRAGVAAWSVTDCPNGIQRLYAYTPSSGTDQLVAYCSNGGVYATDDGQTWVSVTTLSTEPSVCQFFDKLYFANGVDAFVEWDGASAVSQPMTDVNDVWTLTITGTPTGGNFTVTIGAVTSGNIAFNASASGVQTALVAMSNVGSGNVSCAGGSLPGTGVTITFQGTLARQPFTLTTTDALTGGTTPATHLAHTAVGQNAVPSGTLLAAWRNRMWMANSVTDPRTVWWSGVGDATDWYDKATNFVEFPSSGAITGLAVNARQTSGLTTTSLDSGDGVVCFTGNTIHRIYDDSDNVGATVTGGANTTVDAGQGAVSQKGICLGRGRIYFISNDGVYSTDGNNVARAESHLISPLFTRGGISPNDLVDAESVFYRGSLFIAFSTANSPATHNRLLELNLDLPPNPATKQYPWMAHEVNATSLAVFSDLLLCGDSQDEVKVRSVFEGGADISGSTTMNDIFAVARTGMLNLGMAGPKGVRRVLAYGGGTFLVTVVASDGSSESRNFSMPITVDTWNPSEPWGGTWGDSANPVSSDMGFYTRHGRYLAFEIAERSQNVGPPAQILGQLVASNAGGMRLTAMQVTIYPLDVYT